MMSLITLHDLSRWSSADHSANAGESPSSRRSPGPVSRPRWLRLDQDAAAPMKWGGGLEDLNGAAALFASEARAFFTG
jgi:hypothetical protein